MSETLRQMSKCENLEELRKVFQSLNEKNKSTKINLEKVKRDNKIETEIDKSHKIKKILADLNSSLLTSDSLGEILFDQGNLDELIGEIERVLVDFLYLKKSSSTQTEVRPKSRKSAALLLTLNCPYEDLLHKLKFHPSLVMRCASRDKFKMVKFFLNELEYVLLIDCRAMLNPKIEAVEQVLTKRKHSVMRFVNEKEKIY
jgi:hypothetical protein